MQKTSDLGRFRRLNLAKRDSLLLAPESGGFAYLVEAGLLAIELQLPDVGKHLAGFLMPRDVFSDRVLPSGIAANLRAITDCSIQRQPHETWIGADAIGAYAKLEEASQRWHAFGAICGMADIDARVASLFHMYLVRAGARAGGGKKHELPFSREDVASAMHINPDTLSRTYGRLRDKGLIAKGPGSRPIIVDSEGIAALSPLAGMIEDVFGHAAFPDAHKPARE